MSDFTIRDVLEWARTKPADQSYDYCDARRCAVAQFGRETGRPELIDLDPDLLRALSKPLWQAVNSSKIFGEPWTFGALVKRLESLCPETPVNASTWTEIDAYLSEIETVQA